ncbi:MAG: ATP synthase F1 subunit delta [Candidatus Schekmanbacteria bacterium RBG_13_48_7]|uniref:ATP synthase subunit delta n=1 Tax=Candidatus Schekmanbacteria bacterium RBG_13_48_7 TaxID=1817878 RepID=A0A1F7RRL2_9BACT|nr:MAG: ATP synthase F1 subunit delta [Candidatus Schekmanbacteria bacterium RBG_13_48_7]
MRRHPVCRYYSKALIQTAGNSEEAKLYMIQLESCRAVFQENTKLFTALFSSWVSFKDKVKILDDISRRINFNEKVYRFLRIIIKNKRIDQFDSILDTYSEMLDQMLNNKTVTIISPKNIVESDKEFAKNHLSALSGKNIKIQNIVDPNILGGLQILLDGKVYDNSIASKLNAIRKSFLEA